MQTLSMVSMFSIVILFAIMILTNGKYISSDTAFVMTLVAMAFGVGVVLGLIEYKFMTPLKQFGIARAGWAASIAAIAFIARASAIDTVNEMFRVDAGALPMTVVAGSVIQIFAWGRWIFTGGFFISATMGILMLFDKYFADDVPSYARTPTQIITYCTTISLGLCTLFSQFQFHDPDKVEQRLYRIAHMTDFSGAFDCQGFDSKDFDALFIGPEQNHALFAPKLPEADLFAQGPSFLAPVTIPPKFAIVQCIHPDVSADTLLHPEG